MGVGQGGIPWRMRRDPPPGRASWGNEKLKELEESQEDEYQSPGDPPGRQKAPGGSHKRCSVFALLLRQSCPGICSCFVPPAWPGSQTWSVGCGSVRHQKKGHSTAGTPENLPGCGKCCGQGAEGTTSSPTAPPGESSCPTPWGWGQLWPLSVPAQPSVTLPSLLLAGTTSAILNSAPPHEELWPNNAQG